MKASIARSTGYDCHISIFSVGNSRPSKSTAGPPRNATALSYAKRLRKRFSDPGAAIERSDPSTRLLA